MSVGPPWLDEAIEDAPPGLGEAIEVALAASAETGSLADAVMAVLAFAAHQPRPITDAMIEAAQESLRTNASPFSRAGVRAALEAAEKVRS